MGHRYSEPERQPQTEQANPSIEEQSNPFLSSNDLTYLSLINPFLSANGQKLITFFMNFHNEKPIQNTDSGGILSQLGSANGGKLIQELLPALLSIIGKTDNKGSFDPALLKTLLGMLSNANLHTNRDSS